MIFHICSAAEWTGEEYRAPSLDTDGFIHCSDLGTVHLPANAFYAGRIDLVLLQIDPGKLDVPLRWEPGQPPHPAGIWFPHVYGPIKAGAVVAVHDFLPGPGGTFLPPAAVSAPIP
ncbi:MAG TPA: DUF952 domain-containing protein [Amycolatopsis sp.]|uniref:DUF952 domain-containing protein n=1 Tax=Amycolatopsis sp. TaxID=37632 RepID=UPI002B4A2852|nr:DUF952 domain-containing protein [Amycolatopsis sp.]HKS48094.1 DUF952 domain-containing protein [Amycolatopsis sp.]